MTRNIGLIFVVLSIIILTLLEGLLGSHGYFVNRALGKSIAERKQVRDEIALEVEFLQKRLDTVWERDELRDSALRLGYVIPGETVYLFPDGPVAMEDGETHDRIANGKTSTGRDRFTGISFLALLVFSLIISTIICMIWGFFIYRRNRNMRDVDAKDN